ncbi:MAG TPA: peptidoglycan DD-metalloendopeptidase family protein, partial [Limnochordia bacterium]|nr:peptidoglycan DD-metalloendopeptidase family protein [Limnochordia bacterium]
MRLLKRPALWAGIVATIFAFTLGGQPFTTLPSDGGPDSPLETVIAVEPARSAIDFALASRTFTVDGTPGMSDSWSPPQPLSPPVAQETVQAPATGDADGSMDRIGGPTEEEAQAHPAAASNKPKIITHVVQRGETISKIAAKYGIDEYTILAANDLPNANMITVGQKLNILTIPGALHTVKQGESLWEIARTYQADMNEIIAVNELENPDRIRPRQEMVIPGANAARIGSAIRSERLVSDDGRLMRAFSWPVSGRISSRYGPRWGRMHYGIDIAVNTGTPVKAAARGRVSFAGWNGGYGYLVIIDHGNNIETRYAHLSRIAVQVGQYVSRGSVIAYSGNTGNSTGPHLHFEIRYKG